MRSELVRELLAEFLGTFVLITFGVGAGNQTYITSDGGQFRNAVTAYFASPVTLP
jgi:glycerol uptake facilitator-like aquaporin